MENKVYFVVEMLRYNNREAHSYVIGIYDDETRALADAWDHMKFRDGKYGAVITGYTLNENGKQVYQRELDSWDAFAACSKELADKIRELLVVSDPAEMPGFTIEKAKDPSDEKE